LLVIAGVLAAALIAELAIRLFDLRPPTLRGKTYLQSLTDRKLMYHCYSSNPHGEFSPTPDVRQGEWRLTSAGLPPTELPLSDLKKTPWCVEDRSSELDLRDRRYEAIPGAGKIRLALVGDSFVRGEGVPLEGALPRQLERLLGPDRYEVVNTGAAGLGTEEEVPVVQRVSAKLNVSRVILVFIPNDIHLNRALERRQELINDLINIRDEHLARHFQRQWLYRNSRLAQFVGSFFEMRGITRDTIQWYLDSYDPGYNEDGLKRLAENFKALASLPNCRVAMVIYPLMCGLEGDYPLAAIHSRVKQMAGEAGLPVLDLAPAFKGFKTESLQVHPCDHHPNSRAHAVAARAINDWLNKEQQGFLATPKDKVPALNP
jgi:lysophospholipase L1-like esterase